MNKRRVVVAGLGGGGCQIIGRITDSLTDAQSVVAIDTDAAALSGLSVPAKLEIGSSYTKGMGTGGDVQLGRKIAEEDIQMVQALFEGADAVFLVVGLGGGSGTGAACPVLDAAVDSGAMTICFATLPFEFEGMQKSSKARKALEDLRQCCDALVVVANDRLFSDIEDETVAGSFEKADCILGEGAASIWRMITRPGYISLDFADLKKAVSATRSSCSLGFAVSEGSNRAEEVVKKLSNCSLLDEGRSLSEAGSVLVSISGGHDLALKEVGEIMKLIADCVPEGAEVSMGTIVDEAFDGKISVTVLVSGASHEEQQAQPAAEDSVITQADTETSFTKKRGRSRRASQQAKLRLNASGQGRFKGVAPTIFEGEDLDIPTFIRRNVSIQR